MEHNEEMLHFKVEQIHGQLILEEANDTLRKALELGQNYIGAPLCKKLDKWELVVRDLLNSTPGKSYCAAVYQCTVRNGVPQYWHLFAELRRGTLTCSGLSCTRQEAEKQFISCDMVRLCAIHEAYCCTALLNHQNNRYTLSSRPGTQKYPVPLLRAAIRRMAIVHGPDFPEICVQRHSAVCWYDVLVLHHRIHYVRLMLVPMKHSECGSILAVCRQLTRDELLTALCSPVSDKSADAGLFGMLTERETEAVRLVIQGLTNRYIAQHMNISEGTVKKMLSSVYRKLNVNSRIELIQRESQSYTEK